MSSAYTAQSSMAAAGDALQQQRADSALGELAAALQRAVDLDSLPHIAWHTT